MNVREAGRSQDEGKLEVEELWGHIEEEGWLGVEWGCHGEQELDGGMWGPGMDVDRALGRARELEPSQELAPRPAPPQAPPPWCASHKHGAPEKIQVIPSKQPSNVPLRDTLLCRLAPSLCDILSRTVSHT